MSIENQAMEVFQTILNFNDSELEKSYDEFIKIFDMNENFEQALIEKISYCRANNLTEDDLIEENNVTKQTIEDTAFFNEISPIKKKLITHMLTAGARINDKILEKGLYPKVNVRVERTLKDAELPEYAHKDGDSGLDIKLLLETIVPAKTTMIAPTGLKVAIPLGYELQIRPRSGNSLKYQNLFIANSPGTIDANYREELGIILKNIGDEPIVLQKGVKIAQAVLSPVIKLQWIEVDDINEFPTERNGGFGSTGA